MDTMINREEIKQRIYHLNDLYKSYSDNDKFCKAINERIDYLNQLIKLSESRESVRI